MRGTAVPRRLPRKKTGIIAAATLLVAAAGAALILIRGDDDVLAQHAYPRTYHIWGAWAQTETLAKYDMLVGYANYDTAFLRSRNPNGIFLLTPGLNPQNSSDYQGVSITYGAADEWRGGSDNLAGGVNLGQIRPFDPAWDYLRNADGSIAPINEWFDHPGWNLADPTGKGTPELVAKVFAYAGKRSGLYSQGWDGVHSDNWIFGAIGSSWFNGPNLDTDRDGRADDPSTLRRNWDNGLTRVGNLLRSYLPGKIVGGNGSWYGNPEQFRGDDRDGWLKSSNYTFIEHFDDFYNDPEEFLAIARRWLDYQDPLGQPRYLAVMQKALTGSGKAWATSPQEEVNVQRYMLNPEVMRSMRWGLTLAMMAGAYYEIYMWGHHETRWWYDEFDGGEGVRKRGYLGQPLGPARRLQDGLYRRDFENGIVINNSSSEARQVALETSFRRLKGAQNPSLNDGSALSSVSVPDHDGAILLRA